MFYEASDVKIPRSFGAGSIPQSFGQDAIEQQATCSYKCFPSTGQSPTQNDYDAAQDACIQIVQQYPGSELAQCCSQCPEVQQSGVKIPFWEKAAALLFGTTGLVLLGGTVGYRYATGKWPLQK